MTEQGEAIVRIAARGDGVTASGQHVRGAAPADTLAQDGGLIRGPHYVTPPCRHFEQCGGCSLQHVDIETYSDFLVDRIQGALRGQGLAKTTILPPVISPPHSRRRTVFRAIRMGKSVHIGFNTEQSHRVIDVKQCDVLHPDIFNLFAPLRLLLKDWPDKKLNLTIHATIVDQGIDLLIKNIDPDNLEQYEKLAHFSETNGLARLCIDRGAGPETLFAPEPATISLGGVAVDMPPASFLQATMAGEAALTKTVTDWLAHDALVADLFCGLGTFALGAVQAAADGASEIDRKVYAAEAGRDALGALKMAANRAGLTVFTEHRDLFRRPLIPAELNRFEAIILDPPRAGAREQVLQLAQSEARKIIYVSCNPSSFARDAKILLEKGFVLKTIQPVGQFLWSTHVELVGLFIGPAAIDGAAG